MINCIFVILCAIPPTSQTTNGKINDTPALFKCVQLDEPRSGSAAEALFAGNRLITSPESPPGVIQIRDPHSLKIVRNVNLKLGGAGVITALEETPWVAFVGNEKSDKKKIPDQILYLVNTDSGDVVVRHRCAPLQNGRLVGDTIRLAGVWKKSLWVVVSKSDGSGPYRIISGPIEEGGFHPLCEMKTFLIPVGCLPNGELGVKRGTELFSVSDQGKVTKTGIDNLNAAFQTLSPDGSKLITTSTKWGENWDAKGLIDIYDIETKQRIIRKQIDSEVSSSQFVRFGGKEYVVYTSNRYKPGPEFEENGDYIFEGRLTLWDYANDREILVKEFPHSVRQVHLSSNQEHLCLEIGAAEGAPLQDPTTRYLIWSIKHTKK